MRISNKRKADLYRSIHAPIIDLRVEMSEELTAKQDARMAQLTQAIWERVKRALEVEE